MDGYAAHPLFGARLRVSRAGEHLQELDSSITTLIENYEDPTVAINDEGQLSITGPSKPISPDPMWPVLLGETTYNLRAALDYLVYELAFLDSGIVHDGTQFPIEERYEVFWQRRRHSWLEGVSDEHVTAIERLQPYKGCDWTRQLRELSNPDKHRKLTVIEAEADHGLRVFKATSPPEPEAGWRHIFTEGDVHVHYQRPTQVAIEEGPPIVELLERLQTQVSETLDAFEPEFEGNQAAPFRTCSSLP